MFKQTNKDNENYDIYCRTSPLTSEARLQIAAKCHIADLQNDVLYKLFRKHSKEIGPQEICLKLSKQSEYLPSTMTIREAFSSEQQPYKIEAYIVRISDIPFKIRTLVEETIQVEEFSSDDEFLQDYKGYTFTKIGDDHKMRSADFLLKQIRRTAEETTSDVWLPTLGKQKDALRHEQVISYGFEEAAIRRLENSYIHQKRRNPEPWESKSPPSGWRYIKWKRGEKIHTQEWEAVWGQDELTLLECKLCMTQKVFDKVLEKLNTLQLNDISIGKVYLAALLWRGDTLKQAQTRGFHTVEQSGSNLVVNASFSGELRDLYI